MSGPLPDPNRRRRNASTIPATDLPASGRRGRAPRPPRWVTLADAGRAWWSWAWHTPQAAAWDGGGFEPLVARRAALEDDLAAVGQVRGLDLDDVAATESERQLRAVIAKVAGLASHRLAILREMRELDDRLGLTPKGLAALRWRIVPDAPPTPTATIADMDDFRDRYG